MIDRRPLLAGLAIACALVPAGAATPAPSAPAWTVEHSGSSLGFAGVADGAAFEGSFGRWEAKIAFDPADLPGSHVEVTIDMTSADSGDPNRDVPLMDNNWFATALYPTARFVTDAITASGSGAYIAHGRLTIRDVTRPVSLPFTLAIEGNTAMMQGSTTIDRASFNLGTGTWQDRSVAREVTVKVAVTATRTH